MAAFKGEIAPVVGDTTPVIEVGVDVPCQPDDHRKPERLAGELHQFARRVGRGSTASTALCFLHARYRPGP